MNNLFIVSTPYHLLTTFILSRTLYKEDTNYLALTHPHGYAYWAESPLLSFLSSTAAGYKKVFPLIRWMTGKEKEKSMREQVRQVQSDIRDLPVDRAFLSSDIDPQNQLLIAAIGLTSFYRFEDGLYSYYNKDRIRSKSHEYFHKIKLKMIQALSGIHSDLYLNTSTSGSSPAGSMDFMYMPRLLKRYSPKVCEITDTMIHTAMDILDSEGLLREELPDGTYTIYLSQPVTEQGKITFEDEKRCLRLIAEQLSPGEKLIYKPHPNDDSYKLDYIRSHFPYVCIHKGKEPVELLLYKEPKIKKVVSYQSTPLITAKKFTGRNIECFSLINFYHKPIFPAYRDIMEEAGVKFMKDPNVS